jgi:TPR repeat protein
VGKDLAHAAALFGRTCDRGDALGCHNLGKAFEEGRGVSKSSQRAASAYKRGCALGHPESRAKAPK